MVPARGMTGGISSGVPYFGTEFGSSVPPGIWAKATFVPPGR
jgi:hypothetical protein